MTDETQNPNIQASDNSIAVGGVHVGGSVDGSLIIGSHNVVGYTVEQVSKLIAQITTTFDPKPYKGPCPYKGLDVFREKDADLFFGREKLVEDLMYRVKESRAIFITGSSGSGKSSLVRAGLIPALKKAETSKDWLYVTMKPGRDPVEAMAGAFSRLTQNPETGDYIRKHSSSFAVLHELAESLLTDDEDQRLILFVDQFEEVFTQLNRDQARLFIDLLAHTAMAENGRIILFFSLRSDFVPNCQIYPSLNTLLSQKNAFLSIGAMQPEELVRAIVLPANHAGLRIDPALIAQIINDMHGEPGTLPLMQFALKDLFDSQKSQKGEVTDLNLKNYLDRGGIHKALELHADKTFQTFNAEEQSLARNVFRGLIEIGRGTQDTRRTAFFSELVSSAVKSEDVQAVVHKLADARLVTTDELEGKITITISHEKLISSWTWLKKLVDENRDAIAVQNEVINDAKEWEEHQRDESFLYRGARLLNASEKLKANKLTLNGLALEFIEAGMKAHTDESEQQKKRADDLEELNSNLEKLNKATRARQLAAQANDKINDHLDVGLLLSVEAYLFAIKTETHESLLRAVQSNPCLRATIRGHHGWVKSLALSPNGEILASGSQDRSIRLWDMTQSNMLHPIGSPINAHDHTVSSLAFSTDGKVLVSGSMDKTFRLWDVSNPFSPSQIGNPHKLSDIIWSLALNFNGRRLASADSRTVQFWNLDDLAVPRVLGYPKRIAENTSIPCLCFSLDGKILAVGSWDKHIYLIDASSQGTINRWRGHNGYVSAIAFNPKDSHMLASGSHDETIRLWDITDLASPKPIGMPLLGHGAGVECIAFSSDGKTLVSGSQDQTICQWDIKNPEAPKLIGEPLKSHAYDVLSVAFSPDGTTAISGSQDKTIRLWNMMDSENLRTFGITLKHHKSHVTAVTFDFDGKILVSASLDSTINLWNSTNWTDEPRQPNILFEDLGARGVTSVALSSDGKLLAAGTEQKGIFLFDISQPDEPYILYQSPSTDFGRITSVAIRHDGKMLASASGDKKIRLWDLDSTYPSFAKLVYTSKPSSLWSNCVAFSPDGVILASGDESARISLWALSEPIAPQSVDTSRIGYFRETRSVAFSPTEKILATGGEDHVIRLWDSTDPTTLKLLCEPIEGHKMGVTGLAFSRDGKLLASASADKTIRLWDLTTPTTPKQFGRPLEGHRAAVSTVTFSSDGKYLASGGADKKIIVWPIAPKLLIERIERMVGRNFTKQEWKQYFYEEPYRKTFDQLPEGD